MGAGQLSTIAMLGKAADLVNTFRRLVPFQSRVDVGRLALYNPSGFRQSDSIA